MSGMLNVVHAAEHNRELLHAAQLDRRQRAGRPERPRRRFALERIAVLVPWRARTRIAQAVEAAGVTDALDALAAGSAPVALPVEEPLLPAARRFAPAAGVVLATAEPAPAVDAIGHAIAGDRGID